MTNYITSFYFAKAKAVDITAMLKDMQKKQNFPWDLLFKISSDGSNINKAIWRLFNKDLKEQELNGLLPFISCSLYAITVRKGV